MRSLPLVCLLCVALSWGCADDGSGGPSRVPPPDRLDTSLLGPATVLQPYSAPVRILGYTGEASFQIASGSLPPGLRLRPGGAVEGRATALGTFTFEVLALPERFDPIRGEARIEVVLGDTELRMGIARDRETTVREELDLLWEPWVRVAAPQIEGEPDLTRIELRPGLYAAGLDGRFERGAGDDLLLVPLPAEEFEVTLGSWTDPSGTSGPCDGETPGGEHCVEGSPLTYDGGEFLAGSDTGTRDVEIAHPDHGVLRFQVLAVPPDWCPYGEHYGGWQTRGSCE